MNALDMDDGHREQVGPPRSEKFTGHNAGHPASVIIPAALATAQTVGANGGAFLLAILCAYEVTIRLAASRNPSSVLNNATGNWGAYGAAISSAKLLSLSLEQVVEALGIVCAFGPNPPRNLNVSYMGMVKESIGWASLTGASAAALAARGFTGKESDPFRIFEAPRLLPFYTRTHRRRPGALPKARHSKRENPSNCGEDLLEGNVSR
jgi:2-methylcitrate dehydratase PrpD